MKKKKEVINFSALRLHKIKGLMAENYETQADLAALLNLTPPTINSRLKGKSEFTATEIYKIAEHYKVPPGYFYVNPDKEQ